MALYMQSATINVTFVNRIFVRLTDISCFLLKLVRYDKTDAGVIHPSIFCLRQLLYNWSKFKSSIRKMAQ